MRIDGGIEILDRGGLCIPQVVKKLGLSVLAHHGGLLQQRLTA